MTPIAYLQSCVTVHQGMGHKKIGEFFCLEEFVLRYGKEFKPARRPKTVRKMMDKMCFHNAWVLAQKNGWVYVEGYATGVIPVHHAWCVKPGSGRVIDPTWEEAGSAYFGIAFKSEYVRAARAKSSVLCLIDDWERRWPLLTAKPESFLWKRSARVKSQH